MSRLNDFINSDKKSLNYGACDVCGKPITYYGARYCSPSCNLSQLESAWVFPSVPEQWEEGTTPVLIINGDNAHIIFETNNIKENSVEVINKPVIQSSKPIDNRKRVKKKILKPTETVMNGKRKLYL